MFDFGNIKTYAYDVCNTLGRMASSMLTKGVVLKVGNNACTDGEKTIYLPQAMKRHLAWDEIDFVRYLVHHEYAHIAHSESKKEMLGLGCDDGPIYAHIINCLEDVRIEAIASQEMMMLGVYERGRGISRRLWEKAMEEHSSIWETENCLVYLLISCTHFPDMGDDSSVQARAQPTLSLLHHDFKVAGIMAAMVTIDESPEKFPRTRDLVPLADRIFRLLKSTKSGNTPAKQQSLAQNQRDPDGDAGGEGEGGDECGPMEANEAFSEGVANVSRECGNEEGGARTMGSDPGTYGGGMVEMAARGLEAEYISNEDGSTTKEEEISEQDIKGKANGLSFGSDTGGRGREPDRSEGESNYRWGQWAAGMASHVVDKLKGMSRASYSQPKDSGIRLHQRNVPSFLRGLTQNILRRRHRDRVRGTSVCMLIDDSGSMAYEESKNAWRAAAMLSIACERAKIPTMLIRYSNGFLVEKLFQQPAVRAASRMTNAWGGGTNAYAAIEQGIMHLGLRTESRRVIFFLTDGCTEDCRKLVQQCQGEGIEFIPILFGEHATYAAKRGGVWDLPNTITLPDTNVALGPILVERLAATL